MYKHVWYYLISTLMKLLKMISFHIHLLGCFFHISWSQTVDLWEMPQILPQLAKLLPQACSQCLRNSLSLVQDTFLSHSKHNQELLQRTSIWSLEYWVWSKINVKNYSSIEIFEDMATQLVYDHYLPSNNNTNTPAHYTHLSHCWEALGNTT